MTNIIPRFSAGRTLSGLQFMLTAIVVCAGLLPAQGIQRSRLDEKIIVESDAATQVSEKVRAEAPGVLVQVFVKVGDTVKKGDVLGHTELAATKYQLDLARFALENNATLNAAQGHADAWTATREETEEAMRKRKVEKSRLDWAVGMEKFNRGNYEAQLEQKKLQRIQYEYWQQQYEARFFKAPVDGVVTEILLDVGKAVTYATHVFTVGNNDSYMVPLTVPEAFANALATNALLPVRATNGKQVARGLVDSITADPKAPGKKIIKLLVNGKDFPTDTRTNLAGTKFDVLLPQTPETQDIPLDNQPPTGDTAPKPPAAKP